RAAHRVQHMVLRLLTRRWTSDSDPHAHELRRAERGGNRTHATIAGVAAAALDSKLAGLEIDFVVHDYQALGGNLVVAENRGDTFAAQIVVGLWLYQDHGVRADPSFAHDSLELAPIQAGAAF